MTLILAIPAGDDGVVLASDSQVTSGSIRAFGEKKIFHLNKFCAWAGAGEVALIQRVPEMITSISSDQPLNSLRDLLANAIKQCVNTLVQLDFRAPYYQGNSEALLLLHPGNFVFVESRSNPTILHISSNGTPEWIHRPYAIGSGDLFAYALLHKYQRVELNMNQATMLAFKVIEETIEVGAYGLGPPIHLWQITSERITILDEKKLAALADMVESLRDGEIQLLLGETDRFRKQMDSE